MASTIKDVATRARVSVATVSRVINKKGYVSEKARIRVQKAIKELDYLPSQMAINLVKKKMQTIGIIVPDIRNTFFSELFSAASRLAAEHSFRTILCNTDDSVAIETSALQDMISYRVSGIIITPVSDKDGTNVELLQHIQKMGTPVVFVDREMKGINCDGVFVDNIRSSYDATDLLLQEGHRKIAIIAGPQDTIPGRERMLGYRNAMNDWGVDILPEYVADADFKQENSYKVTKEMLQCDSHPTAFFTCNNLMTIGCLRAILECGKTIPRDISLVGFDEIELLDVLGYKISVVSRAISDMGITAMRLLFERMNETTPLAYQRVIIQSNLKVLGSEKMINEAR